MTSTRRLAVSTAVLALAVLAPATSSGAPVRGANAFSPIYVCDGQLLTVVTLPGGANTAWEVTAPGETAATPSHVKWFSLRIYEGAYESEPTTPPVVAVEKQYGEREGQGEPVRCTGQHTEPGPGGDPITVFLDLDFVRLT